MFPVRYFPGDYFAARYWPKVGEDAAHALPPGRTFRVPRKATTYRVPPVPEVRAPRVRTERAE